MKNGAFAGPAFQGSHPICPLPSSRDESELVIVLNGQILGLTQSLLEQVLKEPSETAAGKRNTSELTSQDASSEYRLSRKPHLGGCSTFREKQTESLAVTALSLKTAARGNLGCTVVAKPVFLSHEASDKGVLGMGRGETHTHIVAPTPLIS